MYTVLETDVFQHWVDGLRDMPTRIRLRRRLGKAMRGNLGDVTRHCGSASHGKGDQAVSTIKIRPFDMANYLGNEEEIAEYLRQVLEDGDPAELAAALGDIARARGMTQLARDTGLSRESLYKSLSGERAPSSDTLFKVMRALGFQLTIQPIAHSH